MPAVRNIAMFSRIFFFLCFLAISSAEISGYPDPADIDPLSVLIHEVKQRIKTMSTDVEHDILLLESVGNSTTTGSPDFPSPKPLFEGIFTDEQLEQHAQNSAKAYKKNRLDERARVLVDRMLFLNERGVDITGPNGGYHRSIGGGYMAPHKYEPNNVHWHSYMDEGRTMNPRSEYGATFYQKPKH